MRIEFIKCQVVKESTGNYPSIKRITSPGNIFNIAVEVLEMDKLAEEYIYAILLNTKNDINAIVEISHGTLNSSLVHQREVLKAAILYNASAIVLLHNHPSMDPAPSCFDDNVTQTIRDACTIMDIRLLDHVIIGNGYYSYKEQNPSLLSKT